MDSQSMTSLLLALFRSNYLTYIYSEEIRWGNMPKLLKTRFYLPPHKRAGFVLKTSPLGNEYYEQLPPAAVPVSSAGCKVVKGWKYFRDVRRNLVLARCVVTPANLRQILEDNLSSITPAFCEKYTHFFYKKPVYKKQVLGASSS